MESSDSVLRGLERLAQRNHELVVENSRLRRMLALALVTLWRPERVCRAADPVAGPAWERERKN